MLCKRFLVYYLILGAYSFYFSNQIPWSDLFIISLSNMLIFFSVENQQLLLD
jgi:hypothetical protein